MGAQLADPKDKRILVVDDDESVCAVLEHVIQKEGFQVAKATDGEVALQMVKQQHFDLLVLDVMLPRYGGFEILRELQVDQRDLPVVVVTGRYTDRSTEEMIRQESNVVDFLAKPINQPVLTGALHRVLKTQPPPAT